MTIATFDLDETLADLRSDEGVDPLMLLGPMPIWWIDAMMPLFAAPN